MQLQTMHEKERKLQCRKRIWVLATKPDQVPNHNQISMKWRNMENHMRKTLLQKEIAVKEGRKDSSLRSPKDNFLHPKHRMQLKIPQECTRFSEDVYNLLSNENVLQAQSIILNEMPDEVHVKLNVLGLLMLNWVV